MRYAIIILLTQIMISSCTMDIEDFAEGREDIPEIIRDRISKSELIQKDDSIIMMIYDYSQLIPTFEIYDEAFTMLTKNHLIRFYMTEDGEENIQKIDLRECLSVKIKPIFKQRDHLTYHVEGEQLGSHWFSEKTKRYELVTETNSVYYGGASKNEKKLKEMNNLIIETWKKQDKYDSLRQIYRNFFDENDNRIVTDDVKISREKLQSLKKRIKPYSEKIEDKTDLLIIVRQGKILQVQYDYFEKQFNILEIQVENIPSDESEISSIVFYYIALTKGGREKLKMPYEYKTEFKKITYLNAEKIYAKSIEDILEKYYQQSEK